MHYLECFKKSISVLLVFLTILSAVCLLPTCQGEEEILHLEVTIEITIKEINSDNQTICADAFVGINGIPKDASYVIVKFINIDSDQVNCNQNFNGTRGFFTDGKTYEFQGEIKDKYWKLRGYGEAYPFDLYYLDVRLTSFFLIYEINGTQYGPDLKYTFDNSSRVCQMTFPEGEDLLKTWQWANSLGRDVFSSTTDNLFFISRREFNPKILTLAPLLLLFVVVILSPILSKDKDVKIRIYSSVLVFSPMFIFAIRDLIPSRTGLAIPEFLGIALMFNVASMLLTSLPKYENERINVCLEVAGLTLSMVFFGWMAHSLFYGLWAYSPISNIIYSLLILFIGTIIFRVYIYRYKDRKKRIKTNVISYEPEGFDY